MRLRLAGFALVLAAAGASAAPSDTEVTLSNVPAALDGAEVALGACPQPEIRVRTQAAIKAAREYLIVARTNPGAMLVLNSKMQLINEALQTCLSLKKIADDYHAKCQGDVSLGMTKEQVRQTGWCAPTKIVVTETTGHMHEEWIYTSDRHQSWIGRPVGFLHFSDGRLTSIQRSTP
jgi:hypothetical protein